MADSLTNDVIDPKRLTSAVDKLDLEYRGIGGVKVPKNIETPDKVRLVSYPEKVGRGDWKISAPLASYHLTRDGGHAKRTIDGKIQHYNEFNPGIGISKQIARDTELFVKGYHNSYNDSTVVAGLNYAPLKTQTGDFELATGVSGGVAWTKNGSYAKDSPTLSRGNFTAVGTILATMEHVPSGVGVQLNIIPPFSRKGKDLDGCVGVTVTKRF